MVPWAGAEAEGMEEVKDWITIQELESKGWVEAVTLQKTPVQADLLAWKHSPLRIKRCSHQQDASLGKSISGGTNEGGKEVGQGP